MKRVFQTNADRLLALPPTTDEVVEAARAALKLPARNHAPGTMIDRPAMERFVFPEGTRRDLVALLADKGSARAARDVARPPILPCWLEMGRHSWYIFEDEDHIAYCVLFFGVMPLSRFELDSLLTGTIRCHLFTISDHLVRGDELSSEAITLVSGLLVYLLAILASPHIATTRSVSPGEGLTAAQRVYRRLQAQRGRPFFSFNRVEFNPVREALHNGVMKPIESFAGVRGHAVIGHWRLIAGKGEPRRIWIKGHRRGDDRLGTIVKERHVSSPPRPRLGFLPPDINVLPEHVLPDPVRAAAARFAEAERGMAHLLDAGRS